MTWIGIDETNGMHQPVPADLMAEAEKYAKDALEGDEMEE